MFFFDKMALLNITTFFALKRRYTIVYFSFQYNSFIWSILYSMYTLYNVQCTVVYNVHVHGVYVQYIGRSGTSAFVRLLCPPLTIVFASMQNICRKHTLSLSCLANVFPHRSQSNGRSPVWVLVCLFRWLIRANLESHKLHKKGFILLWTWNKDEFNSFHSMVN